MQCIAAHSVAQQVERLSRVGKAAGKYFVKIYKTYVLLCQDCQHTFIQLHLV